MKMKSLFKIIIVTMVILGLVLPLFALRAEEGEPTKIQLLGEIGSLVNELIVLKDNPSLSAEEKENQEITLRKEALLKILALSLLETGDLKEKLKALDLENEEQKKIQNILFVLLAGYEDYYLELKERLLEEELFLGDLKDLTKEFKQWRKENYSKNVALVLNFILVFSEKSALKTADLRLEKIISDLNKLENAKLIKKQDFQELLNASIQHLTQAHLLNKKAKDLLMLTASTTLANLTAAPVDEKNEVRFLVKEALEEMKTAYKIFLEISQGVKQQLGF